MLTPTPGAMPQIGGAMPQPTMPGPSAAPTMSAQMPQKQVGQLGGGTGLRKQRIASGELAGPLGPGHGPNRGLRMPGPPTAGMQARALQP